MNVTIYAINNRGYRTGKFSLHDRTDYNDLIFFEPEEYELPNGYTVDINKLSERAIFDPSGEECDILPSGAGHPVLNSSNGSKHLKKAITHESADVKALRIAANMTQQQVADASGINIRQIQRMESGDSKTENITLGNAIALADALGVEIKKLLSPAK